MLSEISQRKTNKYGITYLRILKNKKIYITKQKQAHRYRGHFSEERGKIGVWD